MPAIWAKLAERKGSPAWMVRTRGHKPDAPAKEAIMLSLRWRVRLVSRSRYKFCVLALTHGEPRRSETNSFIGASGVFLHCDALHWQVQVVGRGNSLPFEKEWMSRWSASTAIDAMEDGEGFIAKEGVAAPRFAF